MQPTPTTGPPGWYPDPWVPGGLRYHDGTAWTGFAAGPSGMPPGGAGWTWSVPGLGGVPNGGVGTVPVPGPVGTPPEQTGWFPQTPTLRRPAGLLAVIATAVLVGLNAWALATPDKATAALIGLGVLALSAVGFPLVAFISSQIWGTRRFVHDLGFRFRWVDLPLGVAGAVAMFIVAIGGGWLLDRLGVPTGSNLEGLADDASQVIVLVVLLVLAGVLAPLNEELLFRGVLLRSLRSWMGPGLAIASQAVIFGLAHLTGTSGWGNVGLVLLLGALGGVLGWIAHLTGRLGSAIVAHSLFNIGQLLLWWSTLPG